MFKKYLSIFVFLVFSFSPFTPLALAQNAPEQPFPTLEPGFNQLTPAEQKQRIEEQGLSVEGKESCFKLSAPFDSVLNCGKSLALSIILPILNFLGYWILRTVNGFLFQIVYFAGRIMDLTIYYTVVNFTVNFTEIGQGSGGVLGSNGLIYYAWSVVRDILNAGVFFVIVYHAIMAMFNGFADVKKKFIALLIFVVLVNFSLLFVKLVADVSNIAILQIYNAAVKNKGSDSFDNFSTPSVEGKAATLSEFVMMSVNPLADRTTSSGEGIVAGMTDALKGQSGSAIYQFLRIFIYAYFIFIFLYVSAIMLTRAATFIVIMIASPLLVAGWFFSGFKKELEIVKNELMEEALQGPGIIFFLVLSSLIAYSLLGRESVANFVKDGTSASPMFVNMIMLVKVAFFAGFNYYAFKFVRDLTTRGNNYFEKVLGVGLGLGLGGAAWGAKRAIGGGLSVVQNSKFGQNTAETAKNGTGIRRWAATKFIGGTKAIENANFNPLSSKLGQGIMRMAGTKYGMDLNLKTYSKGTISEDKTQKAKAILKRQDEEAAMISSYVPDPNSISNKDLIGHLGKEVLGDTFKNANLEQLKIISEGASDLATDIENQKNKLIEADNRKPAGERFSSTEELEAALQKQKLNHKGESKTVSQWLKLVEESQDEKKKGKIAEIIGKLQNNVERAKSVEDLRKKMLEARESTFADQTANGSRRSRARDVAAKSGHKIYDVLLAGGENRTHSFDLAQQMAQKRVKSEKDGTKQFVRTAEKVIDINKGLLRSINNLSEETRANINIETAKFETLKANLETNADKFNKEIRDKTFKNQSEIITTIETALDNGNVRDRNDRKELDTVVRRFKQSQREAQESFETIEEKSKESAKKDTDKKEEKK